ncbi:helix-turn-helix transcriptional regulator [Pseudovibrio sp. POLY-S9]|uniref:helix-turn-helix domain-containing protein n=1 Tax=Pseudovibrio sp. POLY-S9 TaxID=1576596 RepID=UPI00137A1CA2|nr:helix-turn-helix transcriptional regulator [Pseudovibrio sp. POLY-S9]
MTTKTHSTDTTSIMIRQWRLAKGTTLQELQAQTNIDHSMLSKIENGQRRWNRDHILAIADALCVEPYQLFISPEDQVLSLIEKLRKLPPAQINQALAVLNALQSNNDPE